MLIARGAAATGFGGSSYGAIAALYTTGEAGGIRAVADREPVALRGAAVLVRMSQRAKRWPSRVYLGVGTHETNALSATTTR